MSVPGQMLRKSLGKMSWKGANGRMKGKHGSVAKPKYVQ
jgi:hypothetical protein